MPHKKGQKSFFLFIVFTMILAMGWPGGSRAHADSPQPQQVYEAEADGNTLTGNASVGNCSLCSGLKKVGGLYQGASLQFNTINVSTSGTYKVTVYYTTGDPRAINISANGGEKDLYDFPAMPDWETVGSYDVELSLNAGSNTILFDDNNWYSPDIDRIVIGDRIGGEPEPPVTVYEAEADGNTLTGNASVGNCSLCSGLKKVGGLYQGASLQFNAITVSTSGTYKVTVYYTSGDPRAINISANGGVKDLYDFPAMPDWETVGSYDVELPLNAGSNTILFDDNNWYSPDIDRIVIGERVGGEDPGTDPGSGDDLHGTMYEAEDAGNVIAGNAAVSNCSACSGGQKIGNLYGGSSVTFPSINVPAAGSYLVRLYYTSADPRSFSISVNGDEADSYDMPVTATWNTVGTYEVPVMLGAGGNTIVLSDNNGYSPDLDRIEVIPVAVSYEAENAVNVLTGNASVSNCNACSGGQKVGGLYGGSSLQFTHIAAPRTGDYKVTLSFISGDPRGVYVSVNGGEAVNYDALKTADWNTVGTYDLTLSLTEGENTILFADNNWYSPDIDRIQVQAVDDEGENPGEEGNIGSPLSPVDYGAITVQPYTAGVKITNGQYHVSFFTDNGMANYEWNDGERLTGVFGQIKLGSDEITTKDYSSHTFALDQVSPIHDDFGTGIEVVFTHTQDGKPTLRQVYDFYEGSTYFLNRLEAVSDQPIETNYMAPIVVNRQNGVETGQTADNRVLSVPFDNDMWIRYKAQRLNRSDTSYEVTAIYDNTSRHGLIIGSITHDTWKTGIDWTGSNNQVNKLAVYGGASSSVTHDSLPHGTVSGTKVTSPTIMTGAYADYRDGLEAYGRTNAIVAPSLAVNSPLPQGVPVGWNSYAALGGGVTVQKLKDTSDYFKNQLPDFNNDGTVYINLDANGLSKDELEQVVAAIHANGQQAGIYTAPFGHWGDDLDQKVEGTNDAYTYRDIVLKDSTGKPLPILDGAHPLDPTHPGTKMMIAYYINMYKELGFSYIKLDFLSHGALEGVHNDPNVTTGIQAYNEGMRYVNELLDGTMFISASIAPLFPSQYANSRRIATDTFGRISESEYELNALTYGWWQNGTIYTHTDPDHMALTHATSLTEARSRVNSAVISGTVFLDSDDVSNTVAQDYMSQLYTNVKVRDLALKGKAFRPVEGDTGANAADTFVLRDGDDYYAAVFNYSGTDAAEKTIDFARAGLPAGTDLTLEDLWTGDTSTVNGSLEITLQAAESKLLKLSAVKTPTSITGQPVGATVNEGSDASFNVAAEGTDLTYQWQVDTGTGFTAVTDNAVYSGSATAVLHVTHASGSMNGYAYRVVVKGDVISNAAVLTVHTAPSAPTNLVATAGNGQATLTFTAPSNNGGSAITGYKVTSTPGNITVQGTASPITVTGLTNGTAYTFTVKAINSVGSSAASASSNAVTPSAPNSGGYTPPAPPAGNNGHITLPANQSGTVSLGDGITVSIPTGASNQELTITITKVEDIQHLITGDLVPASPIYELLKNFTANFSKPVTLTLTFDPAKLKPGQHAAIFYYDEAKKQWVEVGGVTDGNRITVDVNHFTKYAVFAVDSPVKPSVSLSDISGHWAEADIKQAVSGGIVSGYPNGTFKPNGEVTRAEFAVMLVHALQLNGESAKLAFTDSSDIGAWAQNAVAQAVQAGILHGYSDGSFRPNAAITRAEMAAMVAAALGIKADLNAVTQFADDAAIPAWAKSAVDALQKRGIIQGQGANQFNPGGQATRAEAVTVLLKMLAQGNKS
ncbi:S-layer homology domain-containing protein [Paenibacillus sp. R14(2021)]|uniref:S-layer homology domain-containing protein n=1 Tax=Paenibacillus sp. R14(2021) TaxID=2859228 RepID=UPI001C6124AC|nr:S-layer homology domain-containing protein [Paenibacillus sp. R14(2021)]